MTVNREVVRILKEASEVMGCDPDMAEVWFRHQPLPGFDGQTAAELVAIGHSQAVLIHLEMLRDGVYA
jgi:hypothetical protein